MIWGDRRRDASPAASAARVGRDRRAHGQSLVEMALALPMLLMLCLGIVDGARAYSYKEAITNSDRQVLRIAASQKSVGDAACAAAGGASSATLVGHVPAQGGDTLPAYVANAAGQESVDGSGNSKITGSSITVTFHCLNGKVITNSTQTNTDPGSVNSDAIETAVCYQFSFLTPLVAHLYGSRNCPGMTGSNVVTLTEDSWERANY